MSYAFAPFEVKALEFALWARIKELLRYKKTGLGIRHPIHSRRELAYALGASKLTGTLVCMRSHTQFSLFSELGSRFPERCIPNCRVATTVLQSYDDQS